MNARYQETWQGPRDHRKAMLRAMVTYLLENGKIETTVTRAKEVRSMAGENDYARQGAFPACQAHGACVCHKGGRG